MCEFTLIADRLPDYIYSIQEALLKKVTAFDEGRACKEKKQILNEALPPTAAPATGLQEKKWIIG